VQRGMLFIFLLLGITWLLLTLQFFKVLPAVLYWLSVAILSIGLFFAGRLWFFYSKEGTPGAGDNMICTALAMEIGKYFAEQKAIGNGLQHTRVVVASWDAEEAGLRGSRAYVKEHLNNLKNVKTYNYNLECMYDHRELGFLTSDLNSFVPLSKDMAQECSDVAKSLGYDIGTTVFPFMAGGTDSAEFAKEGIESTCLAAMSWTDRGEAPAYHTLRDTIEAVDPEAVKTSIEVGIHYILQKDKAI
ncbi:MAG: M28 family peptidase, partial [Bacteroidota bacterium]